MSEINDALKRARQVPPLDKPNGTRAANPLPPRVEKSSASFGWMIPAFIVVLVIAAIFFISWAAAHRHVQKIVVAPNPPLPSPQLVAKVLPTLPPTAPQLALPTAPAISPAPTAAAAVPKLPKLQGIFYSPTAPTAILDGKTIGVGDKFGDYRVQQISPTTVTLVEAGGKEIKIGMSH